MPSISDCSSILSAPKLELRLVQELIIGEDTLRHIYYLRRALLAADAVVRILHGDTNGSGFLVGPELMMTNHHVIRNQEQARGCEACFFDEMPDHEYREKPEKEPVMVRTAGENPLLYTDEHLDVSLVRLHNSPRLSRYLPLRRALVKQNDRVVIIQHPLGGTKRIALQNNLVAEANTRIVQYYTPTMRGSSGSPVLNDDFAVVAIHHSYDADSTWDGGGQIRFTNPDENQNRQYRNQGTSMIALLEDLEKIAASSLLAELTILPG